MSNKIAGLDNQNMELQRKAEKTDVAVVDMVEEVMNISMH